MEDANKQDLGKMLVGIALTYGKEINNFMMVAFWEVLRPYTWPEVKNAFVTYLGDTECGQYMPKPADIKRIIEGSLRENALDALAELDHAIRCHGPYKSIQFQNPVITAVVKGMGGWSRFSRISDSEYEFLKKEFIERYIMYSKSPQPFHNTVLLGIEALSNSSLDVALPKPVFVSAKVRRALPESTQTAGSLEDIRENDKEGVHV